MSCICGLKGHDCEDHPKIIKRNVSLNSKVEDILEIMSGLSFFECEEIFKQIIERVQSEIFEQKFFRKRGVK